MLVETRIRQKISSINNKYKNDVEKIKSKHHFLLKKSEKGY